VIWLGLTSAELRDFTDLLLSNHHVRIEVALLGLTHTYVSSISSQLVDGQVTIDADAEISRSANMTFYDPKRSMALDSFSPSDGAMYLDRMIRVYYVVASPDWSRKYTVPLFCGPISKVDRTDAIINVEAQGKELLAMDPIWAARSFRKGVRKVDVIKSLMQTAGESKFSLRTSYSKLPKDLAVSSEHNPWAVSRQIANGLGYQLFYDARGVCTMRSYPVNPSFNFREGTGNALLSKPQVGYDTAGLVNAVKVKGMIPKGKKTPAKPITYLALPPVSHPLSPQNLGRNGRPRYIAEAIEDDAITSMAEAKALGDSRLKRALLESTTVAFDSLPAPHLEPRDVIGLYTSEFSTTTSLRKMTIPLNVTNPSTVGYLRNLRPSTANIRKRR
jgi:hypothetical protein